MRRMVIVSNTLYMENSLNLDMQKEREVVFTSCVDLNIYIESRGNERQKERGGEILEKMKRKILPFYKNFSLYKNSFYEKSLKENLALVRSFAISR